MRTAALALLLAAGAVSAADAQPTTLNDVEYLQAARCRGLAASENLGAIDTTKIDALMKAEAHGRTSYIIDKADKTEDDVRRMANRAKAERKAGLMAEREGTCERFYS